MARAGKHPMSKPQAPIVTIQGLHQQKEFPFRKISYPTEEYDLENIRLMNVIEDYIRGHIIKNEPIDVLNITLTKFDYGWPHTSTYI